jgi:uncharacterized membrane protein YcaP (DUF421 family)
MEIFSDVSWPEVLLPGTPILETVVRGTIMYLGVLIMMRVILKRRRGSVALTDLLLLVLLADAAQNGLADDYRSIADGLLLVAVLIFWNYSLDWLGYRFPAVNRLIYPPPLMLVQDGRVIPNHLRQEFITREELDGLLREQGVTDLSTVKRAYLEGDGQLSVVTEEQERHQSPKRQDIP